jgi:hypothetical protein
MIYRPQGENSAHWCERLLNAPLTLEQLLSNQKKANYRKWRREWHRELRRARAEREFQSPDWSLGNILSWIAFDDPALICQFKDRFSPPFQRIPSNQPMRVDKPVQELFAALQAGRLKVIRNGAPLPSLYWFGKNIKNLTGDLRFRRDEALKYWPAENDEAVPANANEAGITPPSDLRSDKTVAPLDAGSRTAPRYRRLRMRLEEVIAHIAETTTGGDLAAARNEFLSAAREGALDVEAKASLYAQDLATIPREDWWNCQYLELPDQMASGFFFGPRKHWCELEVKRSEVEVLWPASPAANYDAITLRSPGPKGGEKKPASDAWEIAEQLLQDEGRRPPRRRGRLTALARAVQPLLMERGHTREVDTITKYIRAEVCKWQMDNPTK